MQVTSVASTSISSSSSGTMSWQLVWALVTGVVIWIPIAFVSVANPSFAASLTAVRAWVPKEVCSTCVSIYFSQVFIWTVFEPIFSLVTRLLTSVPVSIPLVIGKSPPIPISCWTGLSVFGMKFIVLERSSSLWLIGWNSDPILNVRELFNIIWLALILSASG